MYSHIEVVFKVNKKYNRSANMSHVSRLLICCVSTEIKRLTADTTSQVPNLIIGRIKQEQAILKLDMTQPNTLKTPFFFLFFPLTQQKSHCLAKKEEDSEALAFLGKKLFSSYIQFSNCTLNFCLQTNFKVVANTFNLLGLT